MFLKFDLDNVFTYGISIKIFLIIVYCYIICIYLLIHENIRTLVFLKASG